MYGIFLDTETNGLNPHKHCVLELAFKIVDVTDGQLLASYESIVLQNVVSWQKSDPSSLEINDFSWDEVQRGKLPQEVAGEVISLLAKHDVRRGEAVFICQNPSFDRAFFSQLIDPDLQESLGWPYHWLDLASMYWALHMLKQPRPWETGVSKDKISQTYDLPPEQKPHRAMNGVNHLLSCYQALVGFPARATLDKTTP